MTPRQRRFVDEYVLTLSPRQAAIRAGYSPRSASEQGSQLLRHPEVRSAIERATNAAAARLQLTRERVLYELARIGFANMGEYITVQADGSAYVDLSQLTADQAAAIQEITTEVYLDGNDDDARPVERVKLKLHHRSQALELLGRHLGLFPTRSELSGPGGGPIEVAATHSMIPFDLLSVELKRQILAELEKVSPEILAPPRQLGAGVYAGGSTSAGNRSNGSSGSSPDVLTTAIDVTPRARVDARNSLTRVAPAPIPTRVALKHGLLG